jgi:hypothetical protein
MCALERPARGIVEIVVAAQVAAVVIGHRERLSGIGVEGDASGGVATIADPDRPMMVEQFFDLLPSLGLRLRSTDTFENAESPAKQTIRLAHFVRLTE